LAEKQYLDLLAKLRRVRGPEDLDIPWMLDHLAEFCLGTRDFNKAYQDCDAALRMRRVNIQALGQNPRAAAALQICRAHLVRLLVTLGRLDTAKGDAARAQSEYTEAVTLGNSCFACRMNCTPLLGEELHLLINVGEFQSAIA
jgi:hypothetical protein